MTAALSSDRSDARSSGEWSRDDVVRVADLGVPEAQDADRVDAPATLQRARRRKVMGRTLRWTLVGVNLVLGIAGLVLPGLQGILHLVVGAALLAPDLPAARRLTLRLFRKWPWVRRRLPRSVRNLTRRERSPVFDSSDPQEPGQPVVQAVADEAGDATPCR